MILDDIYAAIINGDASAVAEQVTIALEGAYKAEVILNESCIPAMDEVGQLFEEGEIFVPEMLVSARAMQSALNILKPVLVAENVSNRGTVLLGTVAGDMHDIGKNLVAMMLEGAGYQVIDLGTDVNAAAFCRGVEEHKPDLVGLSALLTTTMASIPPIIGALQEIADSAPCRIIIGGAPVTAEFAARAGADGYAEDAAGAVRLVNQLLQKQ